MTDEDWSMRAARIICSTDNPDVLDNAAFIIRRERAAAPSELDAAIKVVQDRQLENSKATKWRASEEDASVLDLLRSLRRPG